VKFVLFGLVGILGGMVVGGLVTANNTCCGLVATGVRAKFPASLQSIGDTLNVWPAFIGLANLASP
jgi:hypothetical protein